MNSTAPKHPKGVGQNAKWPFSVKKCTSLKKVCYKVFFCVNNVSDKVATHSLAYLSVQK